jgi:hypothetical protein
MQDHIAITGGMNVHPSSFALQLNSKLNGIGLSLISSVAVLMKFIAA